MTTKITLTVDCATPDGKPFQKGSVRFLPSARIADPGDDVLVEQAAPRVRFGMREWPESPTVDLYACDLIGPAGWTYTVYYDKCPGNPAPWSFSLLSANGTKQRLSAVAAAACPAPLAIADADGGTAATGMLPAAAIDGGAAAAQPAAGLYGGLS